MTVEGFKAKLKNMTFDERFTEWFSNPKGIFVGGSVPPHVQKLLDSDAELMFLGFNPKIKHKKHPEITIDTYINSFQKINECSEIYDGGVRRISLIISDGNVHYRLAMKTTANHSEIFMLSLHLMGDASLAKYRKTHKNKRLL
jgi:hypothetical protein